MQLTVPHPKRVDTSGLLNVLKEDIGPLEYELLGSLLRDLTSTKGQALNVLNGMPGIQRLTFYGAKSGLDMSALNYFLSPLRYKASQGRIFEVDPNLNQLLVDTDIGANAPASYFRPPYPSIYLHFPIPISAVSVINQREGNRISPCEGVYLSELFLEEEISDIDALRAIYDDLGDDYRVFELTFMGKAQTPNTLECDFMHTRLVIPSNWEDQSLETVVQRMMIATKQANINELEDIGLQMMEDAVIHVGKVFLYLASKQAITETLNELDDLEEKISRVKAGKQDKLKNRRNRTYNFIRIGGGIKMDYPALGTQELAKGHKSIHWRRGHFRNQAFGKGRVDRKLIWVAPTLIGSDNSELKIKDYKIK